MKRGLVKKWEFKDDDTVSDRDGLFGGAVIHKGRLGLVRSESRLTSPIPTGQVTSSMTFEVAVQLSDRGETSALMTLRNASLSRAFISLRLDGSHWAVELGNSGGFPCRFNDSPEEDTCQPLHLVMVVKVRNKKCIVTCYRNGKRLGGPVQLEAQAFGPNSNRQLVLGHCKEEDFAPSEIFFARLYSVELETREVEELYRAFSEELFL